MGLCDLTHFTNIQRKKSAEPAPQLPPESCSRFLTDHRASTNLSFQTTHHHILRRLPFSEEKKTAPFPSTPTPQKHSVFRSFLPPFCATFRLSFSLSGAPHVSKLPLCLKFFTFTSFMRLSCCSTASNGVYCSAQGILYFEWSEHEMMQGERCVVNLKRDVSRYSLL